MPEKPPPIPTRPDAPGKSADTPFMERVVGAWVGLVMVGVLALIGVALAIAWQEFRH
jgi:hypothetical protein